MKQSNLNNLLYTDSKEMNRNALTSIKSLEALESLQQKQNKASNSILIDSVGFTESIKIKQPFMQTFKQDTTTRPDKQSNFTTSSMSTDNTNIHYKDSIISISQTNRQTISNKTKKTIYVSIGDINGVGFELILKNHSIITQWCKPIYCVDESVLFNAAKLLNTEIPDDFHIYPLNIEDTPINPGIVCAKSGLYSFRSFCRAVELSIENNAFLVTLPINKYAWKLAGIKYAGHTQYLRERFKKDAIMMLGCESMFVALYTDHIPLRKVADMIQKESILRFFRDFYNSYNRLFVSLSNTIISKNEYMLKDSKHEITPEVVKQNAINAKMAKRLLYDAHNAKQTHKQEKYHAKDTTNLNIINKKDKNLLQIAVLGLNPHAGDNGLLGYEDIVINECIAHINKEIGREVFVGTFAPDSAFIPSNRKLYQVFIAMYHDSGLAPLKALYFDKSINVSLNLPILRTSPDHGTCFDKAYKLHNDISMYSYLESFKFIVKCEI